MRWETSSVAGLPSGFPNENSSVDFRTNTNLNLTLNLQNTSLGLVKYNHTAVCSHVEKPEKRLTLPKK
jgi:hypothetical protein